MAHAGCGGLSASRNAQKAEAKISAKRTFKPYRGEVVGEYQTGAIIGAAIFNKEKT